MKKLIVLLLVLLAANCTIQAQAPQGFNFQGIALDSTGYVVASKLVSLRFSISTDSLGNLVSYRETMSAQTDKYGQFTAVIGNGMPSIGRFSSIIWSSGSLYMKTEIDIANTGKYVVTGLSLLLSVPFALQATTAGNIASDIYGNTKAGSSALDNPKPQTTTGNVAIGDSALKYSTGLYNTAVGSKSMLKNSSGSGNSAFGSNALSANTTGLNNTAIGSSSLSRNTTSNFNTAIGAMSLVYNTSGERNTAIGVNSLYKNTIGSGNTAIGESSMNYNTEGKNNVALGSDVLFMNSTGSYNTALGDSAMFLNTIGSSNIAVGYLALKSNTFGFSNTTIGVKSLFSNTTGSRNTALGDSSMLNNTTGNYNTALGNNAGGKLTSGDKNIFIGNDAANNNNFKTTSNKLVIQNDSSLTPLIYGEFDTQKLTINGDLVVTGKMTGAAEISSDIYGNTKAGTSALANPKAQTTISNVAIGDSALKYSTGIANTAVGSKSLLKNSSGNGNTAIGNNTLSANTSGNSNTVIGSGALMRNTTGNYNTVLGLGSMTNNITGDRNSAIGTYSLYKNTTGSRNTALGDSSMQNNTTGSFNTATGYASLASNTAGEYNSAYGSFSMEKNTSGTENIAFGGEALRNNTTGSSNVAMGTGTLNSNTTGGENTAIGRRAMNNNTTGTFNTAIGQAALYANISGSNNTAMGRLSLVYNTAESNTAFGSTSLNKNTTGKNNTGIGYYVLGSNLTGSNNTGIGFNAGAKLTSGDKNVFIGNEAGNNDEFSAVSNKLIIDNSSRATPLVMGDFTSRAMVINGDISISKTATLEIKNGDTYISNSTKGIILTSPNGSCFRVTVGDDGSLVRTPIACPSYDISSNVSSVKMGTKVWTDKNLDVSTYRNGDTIPQVTNSGTWAGLTTGAWCWYNNDSANGATYGKLYNWYAINDPRGLAPKGWHIATGTEWDSLVGYLGSIDAGGKMKSTSNLWNSPNVGATNSSGFSCLPGGFRADYGSFLYVGSVSWFTYNGNNLPVFLSLVSGSATTQPRNAVGYWNNLTEKSGVYVRCVKD